MLGLVAHQEPKDPSRQISACVFALDYCIPGAGIHISLCWILHISLQPNLISLYNSYSFLSMYNSSRHVTHEPGAAGALSAIIRASYLDVEHGCSQHSPWGALFMSGRQFESLTTTSQSGSFPYSSWLVTYRTQWHNYIKHAAKIKVSDILSSLLTTEQVASPDIVTREVMHHLSLVNLFWLSQSRFCPPRAWIK